MISIREDVFAGQTCLKLANEALSLWASTTIGPRLLGLALHGEESILAELPDETIDCPGAGKFHFYGGHRLWCAPEDPPRTYLPDDLPLQVCELADGLRLIQPIEPSSGIQKQITVRLQGEEACVRIEHALFNRGETPLALAPWAITQFKTGGEAILPLAAPAVDAYGVLPNRRVTLWPYANMGIPQLKLGQSLIRLQARLTTGAFKLGFPNPSGWLAYWVGGTLFVKQAAYQAEADYFDHGSSSECYCDARFLELESLGPRQVLQPGDSTQHVESWRLYRGVNLPDTERECVELLDGLGLRLAGV